MSYALAFKQLYGRQKLRRKVEQHIVLRHIVAGPWKRLALAAAVAAKDQSSTWVIVAAVTV